MEVMRRPVLLALLAVAAFAAPNPQLKTVRNIYLLPMGSSLDQYLATILTQRGVFQVVTDPQKADAIFTDKIGEAFEKKMADLYPPPPEKEPEKKAKDDDEEKDKDTLTAKPFQRFGSFSKGRGTVYIVDRQSGNVVWSVYFPARTASPDDVNRRADQIVYSLRRDLKAK